MARPLQPDSNIRAHVLAGFILALLFVALVHVRPFSRWLDPEGRFYFSIAIASPADGSAQVSARFFGGLRPTVSDGKKVAASETVRPVLLELPAGEVRAVFFEALFRAPEIELRDAMIVDRYKQVLHRFTPGEIVATTDGTLTASGEGWKLKPGPGASLLFTPSSPLVPGSSEPPGFLLLLAELVAATAGFGALSWLLARRFPGAASRATTALGAWAAQRPRTAVLLAGIAGVLVSCHPVIFLGRSFVSPNNGAECLYEGVPSLPGSGDIETEDSAGSDLGATMWATVPYSVMQHEALAHGEWPLRNRYSYCGIGLQAQGISMFGDPLHLIPVAANGEAWAWDVKYLLAKTLFAFGAGLLAWIVTRRIGIAALLAASAPFIGFFAYRFNHPAFFAACYAPWILVAWLGAAESAPRALWKWMLLLVVASLSEFNSGVVKEPVCILIVLNLAGLLAVLLRRNRAAAFAMIWANVLFVLIAAPFWLTFLDLLAQARTVYDEPKVFQIHPALFAGLFDDLFYRQFQPREQHFCPSGNFLLLLGVLWSLVRFRVLARNPAWLAAMLAAVPALALAFGAVPASWITALPFIGKIWHIHNCFTLPVLILAFIPAALGIRECLDRRADPAWRREWIAFAVMLAALYALFFTHSRGALLSDPPDAPTFAKSPFFLAYAAVLCAAVLALPWLWRSRAGVAIILQVAAMAFIHFRHGMYAETKFDGYVMNPQPRQDFHEPSPAMEAIRRRIAAEPGRVMGFNGNLSPNFNAVYGVEHPFGCDPLVARWQVDLADAAGFMRLWGWRIVITKSHYPGVGAMLDVFNVRYLVSLPREAKSAVPGLRPLGERDLTVYESPTAWPRAFFAAGAVRCATAEEFLKLAAAGPLAAMDTVPAGIGEDGARKIVPARDYRFTPNTTEFQITAPAPGVIVLGEAFEEGNYIVTLNGARVPYFRANHGFLGVRVDAPGTFTVRFAYWPRLLTPAIWIAAAGIALLLLTALLAQKFAPAQKQE